MELAKRTLRTEDDPLPKKRARLDTSSEFPSAMQYEKSFMHKETITHVLVSTKYDFLFTASQDGFLKFWRKVAQGVEFVKTFRVNLAPITALALSSDEQRLATCCADEKSIKVFDVAGFDLMNMVKVNFIPTGLVFCTKTNSFAQVLAVTEKDSSTIRVIRAEQML